MATTAGNFTMTSSKFNTVAVHCGTYLGTLLNTGVYRGTLFIAVPSPRGNYITKTVGVVTLARNTPTGPPSFLPNITKIYLRVSKLWSAQGWIQFLLQYIIILSQTVLKLWPAQDFGFRGDNYIRKTVRVFSLAHDMPTGPPLHSYQILSKYV